MERALTDWIRSEIDGENALRIACATAEHHRIQASPGFRDAARMCVAELRASGIDATLESVPADGVERYPTIRSFQEWRISSGTCEIIAPERMEIADYEREALSVMPRSVSCDSEKPIEVLYMDKGSSPKAYEGVELAGKLLFVRENFNEYLNWAVNERGAAGFITDYVTDPKAHRNVLRYTSFWWEGTPEERKAFGFVLTPERGDELAAICLRAREAGTPVLARCGIDAQLVDGTLDYVNAFLPGETEQEIWITAHLCHPKPSANDNASGVGASIEALRALKRLADAGKLRLKRGIRLLLVPEMSGTLAHLNRLGDVRDRVLAGINLDMVGAKQTDGYGPLILTQTPHTTPSIVNAAARMALEIVRQEAGYLRSDTRMPLFNSAMSDFTGGSDHYILSDPTVGVPTLMLGQWPDRYYHTSGDTTEVLSAHTLKTSASIAAVYAALLCRMEAADIPPLADELTQLLAADVKKLRADLTSGALPRAQAAKALRMLEAYYLRCMDDALRFVPGEEAVKAVEAEKETLSALFDVAKRRFAGEAAPEADTDDGRPLERGYRMPVDGWARLLDTEEKKRAMAAWRNGAERRLKDAKLTEILIQYAIDGRRTLQEAAEFVSIDCREPDMDAICDYIRLLETLGLIRQAE